MPFSPEPGEDWLAGIRETLRECDFLVVLLTKHSKDSRGISTEVALASILNAKEKGPRVIPVKLERRTHVPFYLETIQYIDLGGVGDPVRRAQILATELNALADHVESIGSRKNNLNREIELRAALSSGFLVAQDRSRRISSAFPVALGLTSIVLALVSVTVASQGFILDAQLWQDLVPATLGGALSAVVGYYFGRRSQA